VKQTSNPLYSKLSTHVFLDEDHRKTIDDLCLEQRSVPGRRDIYREGDKPEHVLLVLEGWLGRSKTLRDGSRQFTSYHMPGDLCGTCASVRRAADHNLMAITPATVAIMSCEGIAEALHDRPTLRAALAWSSLVEEALARSWMVNLGRRDAYTRTAHLLCELHRRLERINHARDGEFELPLTQEEIADGLGLTAVHVNRTLRRLREEGLIKQHGHRMTILDPDRLCAVSGFDSAYLN
jgi:CRP-like cAMP-binding protein